MTDLTVIEIMIWIWAFSSRADGEAAARSHFRALAACLGILCVLLVASISAIIWSEFHFQWAIIAAYITFRPTESVWDVFHQQKEIVLRVQPFLNRARLLPFRSQPVFYSLFLICGFDWFTFWLVWSILWSNLTLKDHTTCFSLLTTSHVQPIVEYIICKAYYMFLDGIFSLFFTSVHCLN